jgi:molecular chaperone DnaJ
MRHPCTQCHGNGQVPGEDQVTVKIPKGIPDGTVLRLPGHGLPAPPPGGQPGDAFVAVTAEFTRSGADLLHDMHVTAADAALGAAVRLTAPLARSRSPFRPARSPARYCACAVTACPATAPTGTAT